MSSDLSTSPVQSNPGQLSIGNNFPEQELQEFDYSEDETINNTANLAPNVINNTGNAGNIDINNGNDDTDLSGRVAPISSEGNPILGIVASVVTSLVTKYIPIALLIAGGIAAVAIPTTLLGVTLGAVAAPICFIGALWLIIDPISFITSLEEETEIITQRINILDRINYIYDEIEKLENTPEATEAQIKAKKNELEEAKEMLRNFDMHYGMGSSPAGNVNEMNEIDHMNVPTQNFVPQNSNMQNLNDENFEDIEDEEEDESGVEINQMRQSDTLRDEIKTAEENASLLIDQENEGKKLMESIEEMQTENNELTQSLSDIYDNLDDSDDSSDL